MRHEYTFICILTLSDGVKLAGRANLDLLSDSQSDVDVSDDVGYVQIRSTRCLASVSWWTPTGRWPWVAAWQPVVERSIMSWQEGEGSDVLACPERPEPVNLMRLPLTGDVVVRLCGWECRRVGVYFLRGWTSTSLAWLPLMNHLLFSQACLL